MNFAEGDCPIRSKKFSQNFISKKCLLQVGCLYCLQCILFFLLNLTLCWPKETIVMHICFPSLGTFFTQHAVFLHNIQKSPVVILYMSKILKSYFLPTYHGDRCSQRNVPSYPPVKNCGHYLWLSTELDKLQIWYYSRSSESDIIQLRFHKALTQRWTT